MNERFSPSLQPLREEGHTKETTTIRVELLGETGDLETINVTSTWRGLVRYFTDPKVRESMNSNMSRRGFDTQVKQVVSMDSDMDQLTDYQRTDYASLEALLDTPPPRPSARVINLFPERRGGGGF